MPNSTVQTRPGKRERLIASAGELLHRQGVQGTTLAQIQLNRLQAAVSLGTRFGWAQTVATFVAITWNFALNNMFTYRDQRLTGWQFVTGLIRFQVICAIGAISNVGIASLIYRYDPDWWIAGLGGALMGAVWNYVVSAAFVWRQR